MIKIYTDGSCDPNPGPGGWAYAVIKTRWSGDTEIAEEIYRDYGNEKITTNNRMEFEAAIHAMQYALGTGHKEVTIASDSQLLINTVTLWMHKWRDLGWKKPHRKEVKNVDLVKQLWQLTQRLKVHWVKVKAHSGDKWNDLVDKLSYEAYHNTRREEKKVQVVKTDQLKKKAPKQKKEEKRVDPKPVVSNAEAEKILRNAIREAEDYINGRIMLVSTATVRTLVHFLKNRETVESNA